MPSVSAVRAILMAQSARVIGFFERDSIFLSHVAATDDQRNCWTRVFPRTRVRFYVFESWLTLRGARPIRFGGRPIVATHRAATSNISLLSKRTKTAALGGLCMRGVLQTHNQRLIQSVLPQGIYLWSLLVEFGETAIRTGNCQLCFHGNYLLTEFSTAYLFVFKILRSFELNGLYKYNYCQLMRACWYYLITKSFLKRRAFSHFVNVNPPRI